MYNESCIGRVKTWLFSSHYTVLMKCHCVSRYFEAWNSRRFQVDITNRSSEVDLSNYVNNGEWELVSIRIERHVVTYACCPEPFPDVKFYIHIRRRTLYYMYNVIFPCIMMSALTLLVFCLPPDSGEKIALGALPAYCRKWPSFFLETLEIKRYNNKTPK